MPTHSKHHTLLRQWEMLKRLPSAGHGWATVRELVEALDAAGYRVEARTVQRDLLELSASFPIELNAKGKPHGWRWMKGAHLGMPGMGVAEAVGLRLVEDYLSPLLPPSVLEGLDGLFAQARGTLTAASGGNVAAKWPAKVRAVSASQPLLSPFVDADIQRELAQALLDGRQVAVRYRAVGQDTAREFRLHPLGLIMRGPVLYLAASAFDYDDVRLYALHRFENAMTLEEAISPRPDYDLDRALAQGFTGFSESGEEIRLVISCNQELAAILVETPLAADQQILVLDDGRQIIVTLPDTWQLRWWLLSQGEALEVLEPASLRKAMAETTAAAAARYRLSHA